MTSQPNASHELMTVARDLCRSAGDLTLDWFRAESLSVETKGDGTPVTQADRAAEEWLRHAIADYAPGSRIVGEEEGVTEGTSALTWYVDPIDGTKGFTRGVPLYSTLLAVDDEHGPAVGVIHIPATGETVWAGRGLGCHTDRGPATVSTNAELKGACVTTSAVSRWGGPTIERFLDAGVDIRGWGDGYGFLMAATGRVDAMIDIGAGHVWDFAPSIVILSEAGGRATNEADQTDPSGPTLVASNGHLHEQLLELLA